MPAELIAAALSVAGSTVVVIANAHPKRESQAKNDQLEEFADIL